MAKKNYAKREAKDYCFLRALLQYFVVLCIFIPFFKIFYKLKVEGKENIPKNESFIITGTHSSYLDPVLVSCAAIRPIAYMAKKELFEVPILRTLIDWLGAFAVNRENLEIATIRTAKAVISTKKWIMALFPQGGRDVPNKITRVTQGFAYLAKATKAKILPISISGSDKYTWIPFSGNITIKIGKPLDVPTSLQDTMMQWGETIEALGDYEFTEEAKQKIAEMREKKETV